MRAVRGLLVAVLLLVVLLVAVDRLGAWLAQRIVAEQVATELANYEVDSAPPEVSVDRVPFLTQLAAGRYESVTLRLRNVGSGQVRLPLVELTAADVVAPTGRLIQREGPIEADRVNGTATIGYASVAELAELSELSLSAGPAGQLRVELPTELLGVAVRLTGAADVAVVDGAVRLTVSSLTVVEPARLPPGAEGLVEDLAQRLSITVPLPPLPYGLAIESVRAEPAGLVVGVSARSVLLVR